MLLFIKLMEMVVIRVTCETCGKSVCKPPRQVREANHHFCSKECYYEYRRKHKLYKKNYKCDYSQLMYLQKLAKEREKRVFKPKPFWD